jgi:hypothetical protein
MGRTLLVAAIGGYLTASLTHAQTPGGNAKFGTGTAAVVDVV